VAVLGVERDQPRIHGADVDAALPDRDAAVDHVAAGVEALPPIDLGVVGPLQLSGRRIEGVDLGPGRRRVEHAVDHQGRRFLAAVGVELGVPGQAQLPDIAGVDLVERREPLLGVALAVGDPLGVVVGRRDPCAVDVGDGGLLAGRQRGGERQRQAELDDPHGRALSPNPCVKRP
jgi:hypothetical protein